MKIQIQKLIVLMTLLLNAASASAIFTPVPISEENTADIDFGVDPKMYFSPGYTLKHLGASAAAAFRIWEGLEAGAQIRGGINDNKNGLFSSSTTYTGDLGGDVMLRYLFNPCPFFFGVQTVFGYDYFFNNAGTTATNSFLNLAIGLPVGVKFEDSVAIYAMPTVELGIRNATDTGYWGSLISGSIPLGMVINLGGPSLIIELSPRIDDFNNVAKTTGLKTFVGLGFEI